jgi:hypothetical protein
VVRIFLIFSRSAAAEVLSEEIAGVRQDRRRHEEAAVEALHDGGAAAVPGVPAVGEGVEDAGVQEDALQP